jgi:hypothetical protein
MMLPGRRALEEEEAEEDETLSLLYLHDMVM